MTEMTLTTTDPEIAASMRLYDRITPLRNALGIQADVTQAELQLFAMVCHRTGLDPFARQIYLIKRKGKAVPQTGIDGYRSIADRTGEYGGSDEATYEMCDCGKGPEDHPKVARVVVNRLRLDGRDVHQTGIARWHALYPGDGGEGAMWRTDPFRQLSKCAEADGLRKAFPRTFAGVFISDEMGGEDDHGAGATPSPVVSARESVAARAAALRSNTTTTTTGDNVVITDVRMTGDDDDGAAGAGVVPGPKPHGGEPMSAAAFGERARSLGFTREEIAEAGHELYGGRPAGELTPEEWGRLLARLTA